MSRKKFTEDQKNRLYRIAFNFGEYLMPSDCADIINRNFKRHDLYGIRERARVIREMMERCGFWCDNREAIIAAM